MLKQLQLNMEVCRTNAQLAEKCSNYIEATRWKQAALHIAASIRYIRSAGIVPSGGEAAPYTLTAKERDTPTVTIRIDSTTLATGTLECTHKGRNVRSCRACGTGRFQPRSK